METVKNVASATVEKIKEGGEYIASAFQSEDQSQESKQRAAEHHGKAEVNAEQAKEDWNQGVEKIKESAYEQKGKLEEKFDQAKQQQKSSGNL